MKQFKSLTRIPREINLMSAEKILSLIKKFKVKSFLEVGVLHGDMAKYLYEYHDFEKYYAVDNWLRTNFGLERFTQKEMDIVYQFCRDRFEEFNNFKILKMDSISASKMFEDNSIDCIFIDASHDSESVSEDINAWASKAKKLLIGDDYIEFGGVKNAVDFLIPQRKIYNNLWYIIK